VQTWACRACGTTNPLGNAFCGGCGGKAQAARAEELRLVTALFADISGFTTLADTMDVESLHEVITPLVAGSRGSPSGTAASSRSSRATRSSSSTGRR
jgi:hypothetical protein